MILIHRVKVNPSVLKMSKCIKIPKWIERGGRENESERGFEVFFAMSHLAIIIREIVELELKLFANHLFHKMYRFIQIFGI